MLTIEKELFQWEKNRYVYIDREEGEEGVSCMQFYNKISKNATTVPILNNKAKIPNFLLTESLPIIVLGCVEDLYGTQVICRREFRVLKRAKPEYYTEEDTYKEVIYDGGMEV